MLKKSQSNNFNWRSCEKKLDYQDPFLSTSCIEVVPFKSNSCIGFDLYLIHMYSQE